MKDESHTIIVISVIKPDLNLIVINTNPMLTALPAVSSKILVTPL